MGAPNRESDDSGPLKGEPPSSELPKNEPLRKETLKNPSQQVSVGPPGRTTESPEPPRKLKTRRGVFEGDAAAVELRSSLALARQQNLRPTVRDTSARPFAAALRFVVLILIAAAMAGVAGYLLGGFGLTARLPPSNSPPAKPLATASGEATVPPASLTTAANLNAAPRDAQLPAAQTAAVDLAPADVRRAAGNAAAIAQPPPPVQDAAEIAAKMKIGADLMASGDIAAARTMFERVAEAGEAAGAFALAETYDPFVLRTLRLRGGIAPDPAMARRWYESARDMGSAAAPGRIARLTQNPR